MSQQKRLTILLTGGAGFIGSNYLDAVIHNPKVKQVIVVDNLSAVIEDQEKNKNVKHLLENPKIIFYFEDILDKTRMSEIFSKHKPDIVIHMAAVANTRRAVEEPYIYIDTNITGTLNLLEESKKHNVKGVVIFSSSSVYGNLVKSPFKESSRSDFPLSPYGASKKAAELLAYTYHYNFGLNIFLLRVFNVYGPRMRPDLVLYKWVKAINADQPIEISGKGVRKRDYTYVGDVVEAVNRCVNLLSKKTKTAPLYYILNIGNSRPVTLKDLLKKVEKVLHKKATVISRPSHRASVEKTHANIFLAKKVLNWKPTTSLEEGIEKFVDWFRKHTN